MRKKFSIFNFQFSILLLLLVALPILPATNSQLLTVYADWTLDATSPTCTIAFSPTSPRLRGTVITITTTASENSTISLTSPTASFTSSSSTANSRTDSWTPTTAGTYSFSATPTDSSGNIGTACTASFVINNPACDTNCSINSDGTACSSAWSPTTNLQCSLPQTRTCYFSTYPGTGACDSSAATCTQSQTVNTCAIAANPGYVCVSGSCILTPSAPISPTGSCPDPGTTASLSWEASATGTPPIRYQVNLDDYTGTTVNRNNISTNYSFSFTPIVPGYNYSSGYTSWQVRACYNNNTPCSAWRDGAAFYCTPAPVALSAPTKSVCTGNTYTATLAWSGSPMYAPTQAQKWGFYANILDSANNVYQKWVPCATQNPDTCKTATTQVLNVPAGFTTWPGGVALGSTFTGEQTYRARIYNGNDSAYSNIESITKTCPPYAPTNPQADCSSPGKQVNMIWTAPAPQPPTVAYYETWINSALGRISHDYPTYNITALADVFNTVPNTTYTWEVSACNVDGTTEQCTPSGTTTSFYCDPGAWIQTKSGDVHSNEGIRTPGGP